MGPYGSVAVAAAVAVATLTLLDLVGSVETLGGQTTQEIRWDPHFRNPDQGYAIVVPQLAEGRLSAGVGEGPQYKRKRKRRSATAESLLHVNITGFGEKFQLEISENTELLAPGFKVYHRKNKTNSSTTNDLPLQYDVDNQTSCLYIGGLKGQPNSSVAVSLCDGMQGIIRTAKDDYIIEPVEHHILLDLDMNNAVGRPHKLYKRSAVTPPRHHGNKNMSPEVTCHQNGGKKHSDRRKRALYKWNPEKDSDKTVETLVVVDKAMFHNHGDKNITTYTLTLMNMVSKLFRDSSIGNGVNIVLMGLILLEGDEPGLTISHHADKTLNSFCSWQSVLVGANGRQHDHAILLTGTDICSYKNAPCDTLGFAPIEGMCNRVRSCTISEDTGLATALTISHEIGHNFGMFHDGEGNYCTQTAGSIMSPTLMGKDGLFQWSVCSRAYLQRFFNTPQAACLEDRPKFVAELTFPDKLPGELYDADVQCKWQFGTRARLCFYDFGRDICKALWCYRGNKRCETKFLPAAEGTSCGLGMWCRQGKCVRFGEEGPRPVDGVWSMWSEWSPCSRSCGKGVMSRERQCNRPLPQYGGKPCDGEEQEIKICNVQDCPEGDDDFHAVQCSSYNEKPFRGWYLQWKPYQKLYDEKDPCKLYCVAETYNYVYTIKHVAADGTKCGGPNNICVEGDCKVVGCDWIIGSGAEEDICGVCNGDNSTCELIRGEYLQQPSLNTYFPIAVLPKSARYVRVWENSISSNYLAIRNIYGQYYLNGNRRVAWPGVFRLGGADFTYRRPYSEPESLSTPGPLKEDLILEMLVQDTNPGITYEYSIPRTAAVVSQPLTTTPADSYSWTVSVSSCSQPCAGGEKVLSAVCHRNLHDEVEPEYCENAEKPETGVFPCNTQPCDARWVPDQWQQCTKSCGGGKQVRKITCRQKISPTKDRKIRKKFCKHLPKPAKRRRCNNHECPPFWHVGKWTKCSATCGSGISKRKVLCRSRNKRGYSILPDSMCRQQEKPNATQPCQVQPCTQHYKWTLSPWGPCSRTCGKGVRSRYLKCLAMDSQGVQSPSPEERCRQDRHPEGALMESCWLAACAQALRSWPRYVWHVSQWSQCSTTCGEGVQMRRVECVDARGQQHPTFCSQHSRPASSQPCNLSRCPAKDEPYCVDRETWCSLVKKHRACDKDYYYQRCCQTCYKDR